MKAFFQRFTFRKIQVPKLQGVVVPDLSAVPKPAKIKIAIDQSIGRWKAKHLKEMGYDIVVTARDAEKDEKWLNEAFARGALFVISPDLDIPCLIERENYPMIWIDYLFAKEMGGKRDWVEYIDNRIKCKLRFLEQRFGGKP